jgi:hypothetical protein
MLLREPSASRIASERPESTPGFGLEDVNTHGFDPFSAGEFNSLARAE